MLPPLWCSSLGLLWNGTFSEAMRWRPEQGTEIIVVPIDRPDEPVRLRTDSLWFWHGINAFERADRGLVLDVIRNPDYPSNAAWLERVTRGEPAPGSDASVWRASIDLSAKSAWTRARTGSSASLS